MSGSIAGGQKAAATNKRIHGADFYAKIGKIGGSNSINGGFAAGEEGRKRASYWGSIGGQKSRRGAAERKAALK